MSAFVEKPNLTRLPGGPVAQTRRWVADVSELCKARITLMVLVTTLVGFLFGWHGPVDLLYLFHTLGGTALAASGAAALNQVFEIELDGRMRRTRNRPLPGRRMTLDEGLIIGISCSAAGILWLSIATNFYSGLLSAVTIGTYVFVYTPL
jgi:protoheme IX farnesyltransferase